ncbi:MAG: LptA/OstA family protein [Desulfobacca sp.]|uniref:LptA/OstA family protein n=1 Tax=Desulfobacca sp. TaxID=2067990 RepID=UPI00404A3AA3
MEFLRRYGGQLWLLWLVTIGLGFWPSGGQAQSGAKPPEREELPLNITADRLEVEQEQQVISFLQNVVARYRDMILYADVLKIFYEAKGKPATGTAEAAGTTPRRPSAGTAPSTGSKAGGASPLGAVGIEKISRIEALGQVRLVQGDRVATGDKAVYYVPEEKLVLMGQPQLWRGDNSLRGHEIIFYLQENRAVVTGTADKRVEAVIHPSQKLRIPGQKTTPAP